MSTVERKNSKQEKIDRKDSKLEDTKKVEDKVDPNAPKTTDQKENDRVSNMIAKVGNSNVADLIVKLKPLLDLGSLIINTVYPPLEKGITMGIKVYNSLPMDLVYAIIGLILTFFGGCFAVTLSAIEAFYNNGWELTRSNGEFLYYEFKKLWKKSREDDAVDADNDGVADVLQISARELITRKVAFFFSECKDPSKIMEMIQGICNSLFAVIIVLKSDFAKVIALGAMIGENLRKPATYFLVPIIGVALPQKFHQWIVPVINLLCKAIAISLAWMIQRVISSVQSAVRGGLLFSRRILCYLTDLGYINFKEEESYLDEGIGWSIAAIGIYFQLMNAFYLPFPLNILLGPVSIFENFLVWTISS